MRGGRIGVYVAALLAACVVMSVPAASAALPAEIRVAVNVNLPPYQYMDADGNCVGMHAAILKSVAEAQNLRVEYLPCESDLEAIRALDEGRVDAVLGARMQFPLKYRVQSTGELSSSELCLVASKRVAEEMENGVACYNYIVAMDYITNLVISWTNLGQSDLGLAMRRITNNPRETFALMMAGKVEVAIMDRENIMALLQQQNLAEEFTIVNNSLTTNTYTILVRRDDASLQRTLSKGLSDLRVSGEYQRIHSEWITDTVALTLRRVAVIAGTLISLAAIVITFNVIMNRRLKRLVGEKTAELRLLNEELRQRMAQLEQEQAVRNSIIENSPRGTVLFGMDYRIRLMNPHGCALAHCGANSCVGLDVRTLPVFGSILAACGGEIFRPDWNKNNNADVISLNLDGAKQEYRYVICNPLTYEDGPCSLMIAEDVTSEEKQRKAKQENEKNRALNILIAGLAHEIKNPLMTIQTYASSISKQIGNPEYLASFEKNIPPEVQRINRLVQALINYARPAKGQMETFDLSAVTQETLYLAGVSIMDKRIALETELASGLMIYANKDKIKQSILNIAVNGIESMGRKLRDAGPDASVCLRVSAKGEGGQAILAIRDEGCGMTEEEIEHCTDPFYTTKASGTGLGMSLARQFVSDNNGVMTIESKKDEYTSITLTFGKAGN